MTKQHIQQWLDNYPTDKPDPFGVGASIKQAAERGLSSYEPIVTQGGGSRMIDDGV